jgi:ribosomal protein L7/L12
MGKSVLYKVYLGDLASPTVRSLQAAAMGQADRNVGKVSGRTEFYQRLKALSVVPINAPTKGQAIIVGVPVIFNNRISAIKALRELTSLGLKEAKDAIDSVNGNYGIPQANYYFPPTDIETANRQAKVMREAGCTVQVNLS